MNAIFRFLIFCCLFSVLMTIIGQIIPANISANMNNAIVDLASNLWTLNNLFNVQTLFDCFDIWCAGTLALLMLIIGFEIIQQ